MTSSDLLPADSPPVPTPAAAPSGTVPLGVRLAVRPVRPDAKHEKTYYTVTVKEATNISNDGTTVTIQDDVERERED